MDQTNKTARAGRKLCLCLLRIECRILFEPVKELLSCSPSFSYPYVLLNREMNNYIDDMTVDCCQCWVIVRVNDRRKKRGVGENFGSMYFWTVPTFFNLTCRHYMSLRFFIGSKRDTWTKSSVPDNPHVQMCSPVLDWSKFKFLHQELSGIIFSCHMYV